MPNQFEPGTIRRQREFEEQVMLGFLLVLPGSVDGVNINSLWRSKMIVIVNRMDDDNEPVQFSILLLRAHQG